MPSMLDKFGRHHQDQLYRNSSETMNGILLDTVEIGFDASTSKNDQEAIRELITGVLASSKVEWIAWPSDSRCTIGLKAGRYKLDMLEHALLKREFKFDTLNHFYSARLT